MSQDRPSPRKTAPLDTSTPNLPETVRAQRRPIPSNAPAPQRPPLSDGVIETQRQIPLFQLRPSKRFATREHTEQLDGVDVLSRKVVEDLVESYEQLKRQHTPMMVMPADARMRSFEIICGHRRFSAHHWHAKDRGLSPNEVLTNCTVYENLSEEEAFDLVFSENKDRKDINLWEKLTAVFDMAQRNIERDRILFRMGWSSPTMIKKALRIVRHHTPELKAAIAEGLSFSSAFCIVEQAIQDETFPKDKLEVLIHQAHHKGLSQPQVQKRIEQLKRPKLKKSLEPIKAEVKTAAGQKLRFVLGFDPSKNSTEEASELLKDWLRQIKETSKTYQEQAIQKQKARYEKKRERARAAKDKKVEKAKQMLEAAKEEAAKVEQEAKEQQREAIEAVKQRRSLEAQDTPTSSQATAGELQPEVTP